MKRVLILTAGYGEGHNAAARSLAAGLAEAGATAEVRDFFLEAYGDVQRTSQRLYLDCIDRAPWLWLIIYRLLDRLPLMRWFGVPSLFAMRRLFARMLEEWKPDATVSVYPAYGYLLERIYRGKSAPFAQHTMVTDSITVNSIWHRCSSDSWLVPNEDTAAVMRAARVPAEKLRVTGFPVPLAFAAARAERPAPSAGEPLRVLFMINHAKQDAPALVRGILALDGVKLTVTVGKDAALGRQLEAIALEMNRPLELHGWTPLMPELLLSHHILIGKAGGAATQESLAARIPMLITKVIPGQEEGNAELILRHDCGAIVPTHGAVIAKLTELTADHHALWHRWQTSIARLSRPQAARDAAQFILGSLTQKS